MEPNIISPSSSQSEDWGNAEREGEREGGRGGEGGEGGRGLMIIHVEHSLLSCLGGSVPSKAAPVYIFQALPSLDIHVHVLVERSV